MNQIEEEYKDQLEGKSIDLSDLVKKDISLMS